MTEGTLPNNTHRQHQLWTRTQKKKKIQNYVPLAMSPNLRLWLSSIPPFVPFPVVCFGYDLSRSSSFTGRERGRKQKGMLDMSRRAEDTMKPIHQAPTQRESLGVMVTLSEGKERVLVQHKALELYQDIIFLWVWKFSQTSCKLLINLNLCNKLRPWNGVCCHLVEGFLFCQSSSHRPGVTNYICQMVGHFTLK